MKKSSLLAAYFAVAKQSNQPMFIVVASNTPSEVLGRERGVASSKQVFIRGGPQAVLQGNEAVQRAGE